MSARKEGVLTLKIIVILIIALVIVGAGGYYVGYYAGSKPTYPEEEILTGSLKAISKAGKITVATSADLPPWEFYDEKGKLSGFDIDLMEEVGKELGVEVEWRDMDWDIVIAAVQEHKCDVLIGSCSITEKRLIMIDFTNKYFQHTYAILSKTGSGVVMNSWEDLGKYTVGVQSGTTQLDDVNAALVSKGLMPESNLIIYPRVDRMVMDLEAGRVETVYVNKMSLVQFLPMYPDLEVVWERSQPQDLGVGIGLSKNRPELKDRLNEILAKLEHSGFLAQLNQKWFEIG